MARIETAVNKTSAQQSSAYAQTLGNGLRVLEILSQHPHGLGVVAIAAALGVHRTVAYRLIGTLREHNLVTQGADGQYRLGLGLIGLAGAIRTDLRRIAEPHLAELAAKLAATAFLTLADGDDGVSICVVEPRNTGLHVGYRMGFRHPLTVSAAGLAILAGRPPRTGERPEIAAARRRGYAATSGELQPGAWGLAIALPSRGGSAEASVGVVAMSKLQAEPVAAAVRATAESIAAQIAP